MTEVQYTDSLCTFVKNERKKTHKVQERQKQRRKGRTKYIKPFFFKAAMLAFKKDSFSVR